MDNIHPENTTTAKRASYIDVFRGIAIALMIIVNNQGDWQHVYRIFRHASWHGFLGADIVFPFFLFIMGASIPLSISAQLQKGIPKRTIAVKMIRRSVILIAIGLVINLLPHFDIATARIPGVLQRIGLCYIAAGLIYLFLNPRGRWCATTSILVLYAFALLFIGPDGFGIHSLLPAHTICYMVDRTLFAGHTYMHAPIPGFDPEGFCSTLPAIVSTMAGSFVSEIICRETVAEHIQQRIHHGRLFVAALILIVTGIAISPVIPINKNLWTPSYVLFTSGIATVLFTFLKILDVHGRLREWSLPLRWLGANSLFIYFSSSAVGKILATTSVLSQDGIITLKVLIFKTLFSSWLSPQLASFAYSYAFLLVWVAGAWLLYRKGIVVKV